jgi:glycosyltransferase involved in cell wall biosynthesis
MKVIISTPEPKDGVARYAAELAAAVAQAGIETVLFCPANFEFTKLAQAGGATIAFGPERDVCAAGLVWRIVRNVIFLARAAAVQLRIVGRGDVLHFQNPLHFPLGFVFYALARMKGGSIVLTAHDPLPHQWRLPGVLVRVERTMLGWAYRLADAVVVHNVAGERILTGAFGIRPERVRIIPHGPDSTAGAISSFPDSAALRLLAFGAIRRNKGLLSAIAAVQSLRGKLSIPVTLTICGQPNTAAEVSYWAECQRLIALAPEGIEVQLGFVPEAEVPALLARHHALVLPYDDFHSESGVAALALSHRRPVLATGAGGLGELLAAFDCGLLIAAPTQSAVEDAIRAAADAGHGELEQMGLRGERGLHTARSWESIGQRTTEFYRDLPALKRGSWAADVLTPRGQDN